MNTTYKIAIVGETCVGKSEFVSKVLYNNFNNRYMSDNEEKVTVFEMRTSQGNINICTWEFNPKSNLDTLRYFDAAIVMTLLNDRNSLGSIDDWLRVIKVNNGNIPIAICHNKKDVKYQFPLFSEHPSFSMSVKTGENIGNPFLYLTKKMLNDNNLSIF